MVALLCYALLQKATRAICHSTHEGEQTVCLNQFQVSYATTPTTYCKGTVSLSPALLHIHQFQQFVSSTISMDGFLTNCPKI